MRQQLPDLNSVLARCCELGPVLRDWGIEIQQPAVDEHERGQCGHGLTAGPDIGDGVARPRSSVLEVDPTAPHVDDGFAVDRQCDRCPDVLAGIEIACQRLLQAGESLVTYAFDVRH